MAAQVLPKPWRGSMAEGNLSAASHLSSLSEEVCASLRGELHLKGIFLGSQP